MPTTRDSTGDEAARVERGFLHLHSKLSQGHVNLRELATTVLTLVDVLVAQGFVSIDELRAQAAQVRDRLASTEIGRGLELALLDDRRDKYSHPETAMVDCTARLPMCRAACCAIDRTLSAQDVEEGAVRWDLARPYRLRRVDGGGCCHLGADDRRCTVYAQRPLGCRTYSCSSDPRIWKDFERRIPNEESIAALFAWQTAPRLKGTDVAAPWTEEMHPDDGEAPP